MSQDMLAFHTLLQFLDELDSRHIWYRLDHVRESITVLTAIPGERWEIEFFEDGQVKVERFVSTGDIQRQIDVERLFQE